MKSLSRLYTRRFPAVGGMTSEQAHELAMLSAATSRQIGLLVDRQGKPEMVLVGDAQSIYIPELPRARRYAGRLCGLRLIHTHLVDEPLSQEDLMDMVFLRLDGVLALTADSFGGPKNVYYAHLNPPGPDDAPYNIQGPVAYHSLDVDFLAQIDAIEDELARTGITLAADGTASGEDDRAILVSVSTEAKPTQEIHLQELAALAKTAGLACAGTMIQRIRTTNPKTIMGKGKLSELEIMALQANAGIILFDQELTSAQMRNLARITERKILDRTQLILDIFAQHATTRSGKLQVEMAQLQYTLPRLVGKNRALSRLMGGIGGRGPGETKLEVDRRRVRERITRIKKELTDLRKRRSATRTRRAQAGLPVVALVGYTNAGKSTLLNTLTRSKVLAQNKLFATLDPTSRRLRFPQDHELILTDTVGFIRHLPSELREAFQATLEELEAADLLIHVADAGHPELDTHITAVNSILQDMELNNIPQLLALNKWETISPEQATLLQNAYSEAIPISAKNRPSLRPLVQAITTRTFPGWTETTWDEDMPGGEDEGEDEA